MLGWAKACPARIKLVFDHFEDAYVALAGRASAKSGGRALTCIFVV